MRAIHEYPFTSNFIDLEDGRLHYLDEGEGPAVTLLHGNPTWSYYYRHLTSTLASHCRVIVPDHLGCGLSDKPQHYAYTLANHTANLTVLLDHLGIQQTSLVLHDWGGPIGIGFSARFRGAVDKIVILNTAAFRSRRIPLRISICRWPVIGPLLVRGLNGFARGAARMAVTRKLAAEVRQAYLLPYDSWRNRIAVFEFVKDIPLAPDHRSYEALVAAEQQLEAIRAARIPLLIVWGGRDFCFTDHFYQQWRQRFPEARSLYLENAGHYVLEDGREQAEPAISSFLRTG